MISVLLAVYNGEQFVDQAIQSVINQTHKEWELLIGFNGTTDLSKKIVNEYRLADDRIKTVDYLTDKGKAKTLNKLINLSSYDWIAIQDDDDIWLPTKLEKQIKYITEYDVIGTQIHYINENNEFLGRPSLSLEDKDIKFLSKQGNNQIANSSTICKKRIIQELSGWNEYIDGVEDYDLWLRIMKAGYSFKNLSEPLVQHRLHNQSNFNTKSYDLQRILNANQF